MTDKTSTIPPQDAEPSRAATPGRTYRVPASASPRTRQEEHVTCTSIEAAQQWDVRCWRPGFPPW